MAAFLYRIGHFSYRRWFLVLPIWIALIVGAGITSSAVSRPFVDAFSIPGSPAVAAQNVLQSTFPASANLQSGTSDVVVQTTNGTTLDTPANTAKISAIVAGLKDLPQVGSSGRTGITNPTSPTAKGSLNADRTIGVIHVVFDVKTQDVKTATQTAFGKVLASGRTSGLTVEGTGAGNAPAATPPTETIGIGVALIVIILTFAALLASAMPIMTAVVGIVLSTLLITAATSFLSLSSSTTGLSTMIGLAVGIDYSLFVISRYRDELRRTDDRAVAAGRAVGTAGMSVVFAGLTVIIALCALSVTGLSFLSQMGFGAALTVALAVLVALTALPAFLGLFKSAVFRPRVPGLRRQDVPNTKPTTGSTVIATLLRRPLLFLVAAVIVLIGAAIPITNLQLGMNLTAQADKPAVALETKAFGAGKSSPLIVVINQQGGNLAAATTQIKQDVSAMANVAPNGIVGPVRNPKGDAAQFIVVPSSGPNSSQTTAVLKDIRRSASTVSKDTQTYVGVAGEAAIYSDLSAKLTSSLIPYLAIVVGLAFLLLMAVFRSILVPLIAAGGFLLSIAATFGLTVAIFQDGWLGIISSSDTGPLISFMPIFLIGIVFGLAMDYQVFLMSRIREEHVKGAEPQEAIKAGYTHGVRVITAAAIIMIAVFAGFSLSPDVFLKSIGFALALAVFFDAFLVRMIIIPTAMALLGQNAWWLPAWLDKLLPAIDIEGSHLHPTKSTATHVQPSLDPA